jgi:hypothetical protein
LVTTSEESGNEWPQAREEDVASVHRYTGTLPLTRSEGLVHGPALQEFRASLARMAAGDVTLINELESIRAGHQN